MIFNTIGEKKTITFVFKLNKTPKSKTKKMFSNTIFKKYCSKKGLKTFELNKQTIHVKAKERIFNEGDLVKGIYFIEEGKVKVLSRFNADEEKIIRIACKDTILGHRGIHSKHYPISAEALTNTKLTFLPLQQFVEIIKANPEMAIYLLNFMADELRESEERMKNLFILNPKTRVAILLIELINCFGYADEKSKLLSFTLTRTDLANMAATTYETIIRTLASLKELKIIKLVGKEIAIKNEKKLRAFVTQNNIKN